MIEYEFLHQEYEINKKSTRDLQAEFGISKSTILKYLKKYNIKPHTISLDLTGQKFGRLTASCPVKPRNNNGNINWLCKCECGNETIVSSNSLKHNNTHSCGCLHKDKNWKGYKDISGIYWRTIKNSARKRKLDFDISIEYAWELFVKQNGVCALSGEKLLLKKRYKSKLDEQTASLDRINSNIGYVEGNVRWVHKRANFIKGNLSDNELLYWCEQINNTLKNKGHKPIYSTKKYNEYK